MSLRNRAVLFAPHRHCYTLFSAWICRPDHCGQDFSFLHTPYTHRYTAHARALSFCRIDYGITTSSLLHFLSTFLLHFLPTFMPFPPSPPRGRKLIFSTTIFMKFFFRDMMPLMPGFVFSAGLCSDSLLFLLFRFFLGDCFFFIRFAYTRRRTQDVRATCAFGIVHSMAFGGMKMPVIAHVSHFFPLFLFINFPPPTPHIITFRLSTLLQSCLAFSLRLCSLHRLVLYTHTYIYIPSATHMHTHISVFSPPFVSCVQFLVLQASLSDFVL